MTQRKHKAEMECKGCNQVFGIIQASHIAKCEALKAMGINTRAEYKAAFGLTLGKEQLGTSISNIVSFNSSLTADQKLALAKNGQKAAYKKHPNLSSIGGKVGSAALWAKPGQKQAHAEMMKKRNANGSNAQKPNKLEQRFWDLIGIDQITFASFCFWKTIETERGFQHITPDFRVPNTNIIIEVYGNYWHQNDNPQTRIDHWDSVGMKCLVVWEKEINNFPEATKAKVIQFISQNSQECETPKSESFGW